MLEKLSASQNKDILGTDEARTIKDYFISRDWEERSCSNCGSQFLCKPRNETSTCGLSECSAFEFLERPQRRHLLDAIEFRQGFEKFFASLDYEKAMPVSIVNQTGSTLFAGTGGQIFDRAIFLEEGYDTEPKFVSQPVIRLQGKELVGVSEGFSTSFVNIALEQLNPQIADHVRHIDNWLNFISEMGLFMGEMTVRLTSDRPSWGGLRFDGITIKMYYGGLEIGVANWFVGLPQKTRPSLGMSDISFGLERTVWAINKCPSYFDVIGPVDKSVEGDHKRMDSYRTAVLMVLSGVKPGNKDRSSKLRALVKNVSGFGLELDGDSIMYYSKWWKHFADFPVPTEDAIQVISRERNRNINLDIKNRFGVADSIPVEILPSEYIDRVVRFGIPFDRVRGFLRKLSSEKGAK